MRITFAVAYTIAFPLWVYASYRWWLLAKALNKRWAYWTAAFFALTAVFDAAIAGYEWGS